MRALVTGLMVALLAGGVVAQSSDPHAYLEEIEGERALAFARAENARSLGVLQGDPRYPDYYDKALAVATAPDRIPAVGFADDGTLRNYWQDAQHVRGIWRATDLASYRAGSPAWRAILDLDAVAKAEGRNWVWKGVQCLPPEGVRCLVSLSDGGKDAVTVREFDVGTGRFVDDGFVSPEGKQDLAWVDADTVLIGRDWGPGTLTDSGYAYIVKLWTRDSPLGQAREMFRGTSKDVGVSPAVLRNADGEVQATVFVRYVSIFETEFHLTTPQGTMKLPLPLRSSLQGLVDGQLVFTLEEDWAEHSLKEGDLIAYDAEALKADTLRTKPTLALRPTASQAITGVATTRNRLVVTLYENVKGQVLSLAREPGGWTATRLDLPKDVSVGVASASDRDDRLLVNVASFLVPSTQLLADAGTGRAETLRTLAPRFDASTHVVEQFWAASKDGTKVPYFVVRPRDLKFDGQAPTLINAYGGFQVAQTPGYSGTVGKLWLEKGGVYVVANIRGGGEFGPAWHKAGLKANRQKVFDDFFAVAEDLIARKITSPRRLGVIGGSNGGLLMGVALTQRPDLFNAIVIQVPLFDMIGYTKLGAGASWIGEYGDPEIPAERAVLERYSPYQNLRPGQKYPEVYIDTSTKDDRVHPAHARKAAARLKDLGYPYLYYENIDGGHSAAANLEETARRLALEYVYLARKLMD